MSTGGMSAGGTADGLVILVRFTIAAGRMPQFLDLLRQNAEASVRDEPGCRRFDVGLPEDDENEVVLYEIYDSPAAFEAHLGTPHFAAFRDATQPLIAASVVRRLWLHEHAKPPH